MASSDTRTYADAIAALNTLQTPYNKLPSGPAVRPVDDTAAALRRLGIPLPALDDLNVVHVAGTKGKGTVCAMVVSILQRHVLGCTAAAATATTATTTAPTQRLLRVGLLTSPHLVAVRERIRIGPEPLSEPAFALYFFQVWDRLARPDARPSYARFLTLVALAAFRAERVDVAVLETGVGGETDSTNVVPRPAAVGITSLGLDHVDVLGGTIEEIAWHKGGIIKAGCGAALAVRQAAHPAAEAVLRARAAERGVALTVVDPDPRLAGVRLRPDAEFQRLNASLAVRLAEAALARADPAFAAGGAGASGGGGGPGVLPPLPLPRAFVEGLEQFGQWWRGRCEVLGDMGDGVAWHLDCAHTTDSLAVAAAWFLSLGTGTGLGPGPEPDPDEVRVLVFGQQLRATSTPLLDVIHARTAAASLPFGHVLFCTPITYSSGEFKPDLVNARVDPVVLRDMTVQRRFAAHWRTLDPAAQADAVPTIEDAVGRVRALAAGRDRTARVRVRALVTGGVHVVGGLLSVLEGRRG